MKDTTDTVLNLAVVAYCLYCVYAFGSVILRKLGAWLL